MKFNWLKQMQILSWRSLQNFNCMLAVNSTVLYWFPKILMYLVVHHTSLSYILLALLFYKCVWWSNVMIYGDEIWNKEEDLRLDHWTNLQRLLVKNYKLWNDTPVWKVIRVSVLLWKLCQWVLHGLTVQLGIVLSIVCGNSKCKNLPEKWKKLILWLTVIWQIMLLITLQLILKQCEG